MKNRNREPVQDPITLVALVVDDEPSIRDTLEGVLNDEGWVVIKAKSGREGLQKFVSHLPNLVLLDVWMEGLDGIGTLQKMIEFSKSVPIVIMSGHGSIETAVRATKLGAFDFLEKPLSIDKLLPMLEHAKAIQDSKQNSVEAEALDERFIGNSASMNQISRQIDLVAPRNAWVLITGENGTGKEVVASRIHKKSSRASHPFIAVNCAAIPDELIESELFGHTKGAFTNAVSTKKGRFELANLGTLFLDEIADMSLRTQAKILRILQEQCFERVGGTESISVDVRVIAATNKSLKDEIEAGNFREDLYYRLNVIPFHLPPLRERGDDILELTDYFLARMASDLSEPKKSLSPEAEKAFLSYTWPGNVRELKNLLERLCIMVPGPQINLGDLGDFVDAGDVSDHVGGKFQILASNLKQAKSDFERAFILDKLEEHSWNVSKTAEAIGIERSNLHRKIKSLEIDTKRLKG